MHTKAHQDEGCHHTDSAIERTLVGAGSNIGSMLDGPYRRQTDDNPRNTNQHIENGLETVPLPRSPQPTENLTGCVLALRHLQDISQFHRASNPHIIFSRRVVK